MACQLRVRIMHQACVFMFLSRRVKSISAIMQPLANAGAKKRCFSEVLSSWHINARDKCKMSANRSRTEKMNELAAVCYPQ